MTLPKFTLISSAAPLGALNQALDQISARYGQILDVRVFLTHLIQADAVNPETVLGAMTNSDVVLFDLRGNPDRALALVREGFERTASKNTPFIPVFGGGPSVLRLLRMGGFSMARVMQRASGRRAEGEGSSAVSTNYRRIKQLNQVVEKLGTLLPVGVLRHARNWVRCTEYWTNSGSDNLRELLLFVAKEYAGLDVKAHPPFVYPDSGFYDRQSQVYYDNLDAYLAEHALDVTRPTVLVILYGGTTMDACLAGSRELLDHMQSWANVLPFFADGIGTAAALRQHLFQKGQSQFPMDAIVSLQWFRLEGGPLGGDPQVTYDVLQALGAPLYTPVTSYNRPISDWRERAEGVTPVETLATITLPELDGALEPIFLFGLRDLEGHAPTESATQPVAGRGAHLSERVRHRVALRSIPNRDKRVALVLFNYPPGEGRLGEASFLDVFDSVRGILQRLKAEGYTVEIPSEPLKDLLLSRGLMNTGQWTHSGVTARHALRVPGRVYGRWYAELPLTLRRATESLFGPPPGDVMVDGNALLIPALQLGNVLLAVQPSRGVHEDPTKVHHDKALPPHHQYIAFYRYLEEEFRADAVIHVGTHGTLEFLPGKEAGLSADCVPDALLGALPHIYLYHVVNASEAMIAKRRSYAQLVTYASPSFAPAELYEDYLALEDLLDEYVLVSRDQPGRASLVLEQIRDLAENTGLMLEGDTSKALEHLHAELTSLKRAAIPVGLHVFGARLEGEALVDYLALIARYDRMETPALTRQLAEAQGLKYDALLAREAPQLAQLDAESRALIAQWLVDGTLARQGAIGQYVAQVYDNVRATDELGGLVRALAGDFLMPNLAGDPVRSPETYPTGRNAYQFDPTRVPTPSAVARGRAIAEESLRQYHKVHGAYPRSVAVVLWGFETCKTYGETLGQVLGYLGVTLVQGEGYYIQPEALPLEDLGRPRVDVVVNICGFFRDLFPNQVRMLDQAFQLVAGLDEAAEMNYVRANTLTLAQHTGDAQAASARIFGPPPGEYGNRLSTMIEGRAWQDEDELVAMFLERTQYRYGDNIHGEPAQLQLEACLAQVDLVTQVRDSHEFEVTDLDHYYEFFGGLSRSAQWVQGGRELTVLIADTTSEIIQVRPVEDAVRRGVITRLLNPQWIEGMLAHDFHGAQKIADRATYLVGLDATTRSVGSTTWRQVAERYVFDDVLRRRMLENNPYASADLVQTLGEAIQRGYWDATEEEQRQLKEAYLEIETWIEAGQT